MCIQKCNLISELLIYVYSECKHVLVYIVIAVVFSFGNLGENQWRFSL